MELRQPSKSSSRCGCERVVRLVGRAEKRLTRSSLVGNARPLDQALQHATSEMMNWLATDFGLDAIAASHVLGQCARYDIANVYNPAFSVACRLPRRAIPDADVYSRPF